MANSNATIINNEKVTAKNSQTSSDYGPPHLPTATQKIHPFNPKHEILSPTQSNVVFVDSLPSMPIKQHTTILPNTRNPFNDFYKAKTEGFSISHNRESPSLPNETFTDLEEMKDGGYGFSKWYNGLKSKKPILFKFVVATIITLVAATALALPLYFFLLRPNHYESSFANITVSACSQTTCIGQETPYRSSIVTVLFTFNGNSNDETGYYTGIVFGGVSANYGNGYITQSIVLTLATPQYVQVLNLNLAQQSFTLEAWIYLGSVTTFNDYGLFAQCDAYNVCMSISLRNTHVTFSLNSMNVNNITLTGATVITAGAFYHIAVVYDATQFQQLIYVDGQIDAVSNGIVYPYQGSSSSLITTIGRSTSFAYPNSYFVGRINTLTISAGYVRSACEILNDASLVLYYPFSTTDTYNDYSVNQCNGIASGITPVSSGRVGQAISFGSSTSYFQSYGVPRTRANYEAFTISMWINPTSTTGGGSLVHISTLSNGSGICYDLLGLTSSGVIVVQWIMTAANVNSTSGPIILANTWTHIAVVFQTSNGVRLYINGQFSSASLNTAAITVYETGNAPSPWYMILGNISPTGSSTPVNCLASSPAIAAGYFPGAIDEFRYYNRDLNSEEICVLANP